MGIHRFLAALLHGRPLTVWGDGEQIRDFTYVGDVVRATVGAGTGTAPPGSVSYMAGGSSVSVNGLIALLDARAHWPRPRRLLLALLTAAIELPARLLTEAVRSAGPPTETVRGYLGHVRAVLASQRPGRRHPRD
jgi:nucleoside-diphosphate-sugar epimerase